MGTIYFENKAGIGIDLNKLDRIAIEATLPAGRIILVFNDRPLPGNMQGACTPRRLLKFSRSYTPVCYARDFRNWDVCVAITNRFCLLSNEYPAYFMYLIGHEFGHAKICLLDLDLHVHYCLIENHIKLASNYEITRIIELPHEQIFDRFGIYLAERLYSRDQFNMEIRSLLDRFKCNDRDRLHIMLSLDPSDNLFHLRDELVAFSRPYKSALISSWQRERNEWEHDSLASWFDDYDALFE